MPRRLTSRTVSILQVAVELEGRHALPAAITVVWESCNGSCVPG